MFVVVLFVIVGLAIAAGWYCQHLGLVQWAPLWRRTRDWLTGKDLDEGELDWSPRAGEVPVAPEQEATPRAYGLPPLPEAAPRSRPQPPVQPQPSAPREAPRQSHAELPVIDLRDVQANLHAGLRRQRMVERTEPTAGAKPPRGVPVIDPATVRANLSRIHKPERPPAPPPKPETIVLNKPAAPLAPPPLRQIADAERERMARTLFGHRPEPRRAEPAPDVPASLPAMEPAVLPSVPAQPEVASPLPPLAVAPWQDEVDEIQPEAGPVEQEPAPVVPPPQVPPPVWQPAAAPAPQPVTPPWQPPESTPRPAPVPPASMPSSAMPFVVLDDAPRTATAPAGQGSVLPPVGVQAVSYGEDCLPPLALLRPADPATAAQSEDELIERGIVIEEKCAEFKVKVSVVDAYAGPVITRYEVEPAVGVRGSQVVNLMKDLSRALGLASIRVVETIPGKTCMGLELPNPRRQMIRLSEIFGADVFQEPRSRLTLALGKDITGQPVTMDLARAPHLLVAGTTGSGKSVGVNAMILSMLYKATPEEVRFIMIDPKMLELSVYNDIPHLLAPVVTDMKLAANALNWCVGEMERRYRLMSALGVRNLAGYNDKVREAQRAGRRIANPFSLTPEAPEPLETLPFIVVVVDEFADLMMVAGKKIEELIARIAQKARAAGIHLILATQRPSVDVITGLIKANIPTRIAFQVSSKVDSRTILDQMGAESLLGQGDMLFLPPGTGYPQRVHGAFVTDDEVHAVVEHLKQFGEPNYIEGLLTGEAEADAESAAAGERLQAATESDPLYDEAVEIVLRTRKATISSVQRHLRIGYNRAARLIEQMEAAGLVSAMENNGNRSVLVPERDY